MRARRVIASAGLMVTFALLALGCSAGADDELVLPDGRAIAIGRSIAPTTHLFADPVRARLEIVVDRTLLDPERIDLEAKFGPYEQVGEAQLARTDFRQYTRLRYEFTLRCLTLACVPEEVQAEVGPGGARGERRTFRLAPAQILYDDPSGDLPPVLRTVAWPPLTSVSRLSVALVQSGFPFRATPTALPAASYRVSPPLLAGALVLAALALLVLPTRLGLRWWRRRHPPAVEETDPHRTPLERAILLVEWANERPDGADRRKALEQLAAELAQAGEAKLGEEAGALAWSRVAPSSEAASALVERVRESDGASARA
ncbi:MAG: hypothetical protein M3546_14555 [Actinomycetota bacterium]|nr:hypothetical protein [Actinomycetota bacterium]